MRLLIGSEMYRPLGSTARPLGGQRGLSSQTKIAGKARPPIACDGINDSVGGYFANAIIRQVGDDQTALAINDHARRLAQRRSSRLLPVSAKTLGPLARSRANLLYRRHTVDTKL